MEDGAKVPVSRELEDALMYLPRKALSTYRKGQIIFDERQLPVGIYLVVQGRVKVTSHCEDGSETIIDIFGSDDFFGENCLLGSLPQSRCARALDDASLMSWTTREIEEQSERQPKLALALLQMLVRRGLDYQARLQSFALDKTPERVARCLLAFGDRMGTGTQDGDVDIPPMTHQIIAQYVGTTREIISFQMNHLRQMGLLRYSRKSIHIDTRALRNYLRLLGQQDIDHASVAPQTTPLAGLHL